MKTLTTTLVLMLITVVSAICTDCNYPVHKDKGGAYLTFADKFGGELTPQEISKNSTLGIKGCAEGSTIFTYRLEVTKGNKLKVFIADSDKLDADALKYLRTLTPGDEFIFKNVKARLPKGGTVDVWGKKFVVVKSTNGRES